MNRRQAERTVVDFSTFDLPNVEVLGRYEYSNAFILLLLISGCLGPVTELYPEKKQRRSIAVYVVSQGWHVGIAFKAKQLREQLPDHDELPNTDFFMVGWGDNRYYPAENPGIGKFLRAALLPTGSVIQVVGFNKTVEAYFMNSEIVRVQVSEQGIKAMTKYIAERFNYTPEEQLQYVNEGLYSRSAFFEADGLYYFPKTSNWWAARVLRESGFPITPLYAITSGNVIYQARKSGEVVQ